MFFDDGKYLIETPCLNFSLLAEQKERTAGKVGRQG
jgi:hypothetical protein